MSYTNFYDASNALAGIEAVDYYLARELSARVGYSTEQCHHWFHILLTLSYWQRQGHSCLTLSEIAEKTLFQDESQDQNGWVVPSLTVLQHEVEQALQGADYSGLLRLTHGKLYTLRYWQFEQDIVGAVAQRTEHLTLSPESIARVQQVWPALFPMEVDEQDWQQVATAAALQKAFAIISGGPGTGKTYTVARLLLCLQAANAGGLTIQLAAPTGKAAQRLSESIQDALIQFATHSQLRNLLEQIPNEAKTLHRLLGIKSLGVQCRYNAANPLDADVIIVDESSMIDVALMARLVRAMAPHTRLFLIGDPHQLPAVESGNVLGDMVSVGMAFSRPLVEGIATICPHLPAIVPQPGKQLDYVLGLARPQRFSGALADCADAINQGRGADAYGMLTPATPKDTLNNNGVYRLAPIEDNEQIKRLALLWFGSIRDRQRPEDALEFLSSRRWLSPVKRGPFGVETLNQIIENALVNQSFERPSVNLNRHYAGRPIMVTENAYSQRLFNGDVGVVWPDDQGVLRAWFLDSKGNVKRFSLSRLPRVETVYAMTIHKSQGSEFERLLMWVPPQSDGQGDSLCTRELLYTGLTRAKKSAVLVTSAERFKHVVATQQSRSSGLSEQLIALE